MDEMESVIVRTRLENDQRMRKRMIRRTVKEEDDVFVPSMKPFRRNGNDKSWNDSPDCVLSNGAVDIEFKIERKIVGESETFSYSSQRVCAKYTNIHTNTQKGCDKGIDIVSFSKDIIFFSSLRSLLSLFRNKRLLNIRIRISYIFLVS